VSDVIPPARAIGCVVFASTTIVEPGVIHHIEGTRFPLGEPDRSKSDRCQRFSEAMTAAGFKSPVTDIRSQIWLKLMGNVAFNPVSALTGATMAEICSHAAARELVVRLMEETLAVATALGDPPPAQMSIARRLAGAERVGDHKTSMLQDLEAGKQLELDALLAAVLELAGLVQVDTPHLRAVHAATSLLATKQGL
jgi:2-dehydropantoate 2-reductase